MAKVSVTYRAPEGDAETCQWGQYTFFNGKTIEIEENAANEHMLAKMRSQPQNFDIKGGSAPKAEPKKNEHAAS